MEDAVARHRAKGSKDLDDAVEAEEREPADVDEDDLDDATEDIDDTPARTSEADAFWSEVRVDPVEVALPRGVGYTLRAYRLSTILPKPERPKHTEEPEEIEADEAGPDRLAELGLVEVEPASLAGGREEIRGRVHDRDDEDLEDDEFDEDDDADDLDDEDFDDDLEDDVEDDEDEDLDEDEAEDEEKDDKSRGKAEKDTDEAEEDEDEEEEPEPEPEEVPVFLAKDGKLLLFRSPEGLVDFVKSDEPHDLTVLKEWSKVVAEIQPEYIAPVEEDRYELDLVVENLRGGHDAWKPELVIKAGEFARDAGYALRLASVLGALSPGSPLDELDEALRAAEAGGVRGFFARRRLRRIGPEQAALAWRSIIGKISTAVDWRD